MTQRFLSVIVWLVAASIAAAAWAYAFDENILKVFSAIVAFRITLNLMLIGIMDLISGGAGGSRNL